MFEDEPIAIAECLCEHWPVNTIAHKVFGSYTCQDGRTYSYWGRCSSQFPLRYEVFVCAATDRLPDPRKHDFRLEGELINIQLDSEGIKHLVASDVARQLEEAREGRA